jgi:hypothetical protein
VSGQLSIPQRHGQVLCRPELGRWVDVARQGARALEGARVFGVALRDVREQARAEILSQAQALLEQWGFPAPVPLEGPWVATGHQPALFHPGIWLKTLAVDRCMEAGAAGLNVVVDSDECGAWSAVVPRRDGRLVLKERVVVQAGPEVPYEALPPPEEGTWEGFCDGLEEDLATVDRSDLAPRVERLRAHGRTARARTRHLGEFGAWLRRAAEGLPHYLEVLVSQLSRTVAFAQFVSWLAQDAQRFLAVHNRALGEHRREEGLRSAAQPFPDLRQDQGLVELPLWLVREGRRRPLFVRPGRPPVLYADGQPLSPVSQEGTLPEGVRPRALALTLFVRLCVCDLFVHGLGGARYDRVTDRVAREFFGLELPAFAILTGTFHLPLARHADPSAEYARRRQLWLDLQHNPDRHLPRDGETAPLVEEKWRCIRALESPSLPRRERRQLTQRIREINQALRQRLHDRLSSLEAELAALRAEVEEHEAATHRGYAFFLFDAAELRDALPTGAGTRC